VDDARTVFDDHYFAAPYVKYAELHAGGCPVRHTATQVSGDAWLITGYDEVRAAFTDPRLSRRLARASAAYLASPGPVEFLQKSVLTEDPPEHTRYRKLLNVAFLPRTVQRLQSRIEEVADGLIDELSGRREADLVPALAVALPIRIIAELLGVPAEHEGYFRELGNGMLSLDEQAQRGSMVAMFVFLQELLERKRAEPADDILSYWVTAVDDYGEPMDEQELIGLAMVVLVGGYDTTVGMIGAMLLGLLAEPERIDGVRDDPRRLTAAVEEYLRLYGTVHTSIRRFAATDLEVGGELIRAGDTVLLSLAAADRDPRQFPQPDVADFDRPNAAAHLAFGRGVHVCPGNALARAEIAVAVGTALRRLPGLRLTVPAEEISWRPVYSVRIPLHLPVAFDDVLPVRTLRDRLARLPRSERRAALRDEITAMFRRTLLMDESDELAPDANYFDLGISSLQVTGIKQDLETALGCEIQPGELFGRPSITQIVEHISGRCLPEMFDNPAPANPAPAAKPLVDKLISSLYES
jgi:cytochrome P450/acyl carrier protein